MSLNRLRIFRVGGYLLWLVPLGVAFWVVSHVTAQPAPKSVSTGHREGGVAVPEDKQHEIFDEIAGSADSWRRRASRKFPNSKWSQEDHYHNLLRKKIERISRRSDLSYTTIYWIYDRGIRRHWKGPDGETLPATTVPLNPRSL